jgi:hypothetical protein
MTCALYWVSMTYDLVVLFEHPEWQRPLCEEVPWCDGRTLRGLAARPKPRVD